MSDDDVTKRPGTVHRVKARKQHDCAECADPILKGQGYIYLNTFDRGQWGRYVLCLECERILNCHRVVELSLGSEWPHAHGRLREEVKAHIRQSGAYKRAFNEAWAASEPMKEQA
jgi:hypothetical protein